MMRGKQIRAWKEYRALRHEGHSTESAARIANVRPQRNPTAWSTTRPRTVWEITKWVAEKVIAGLLILFVFALAWALLGGMGRGAGAAEPEAICATFDAQAAATSRGHTFSDPAVYRLGFIRLGLLGPDSRRQEAVESAISTSCPEHAEGVRRYIWPPCDPVVRRARGSCPSPVAIGGHVYADGLLRGGSSLPLRLDVYRPLLRAGVESYPAVLFIHGGGFQVGTRNRPDQVAWMHILADRGFVVASIDYRLMGNNPAGQERYAMSRAVTAARQDAERAVAWLLSRPRLRIDPSRVVIAGSSAGAVTALNTAHAPGAFPYAGVVSMWGGLTDFPFTSTAPHLVIHGRSDEAVSFDFTRQLVDHGAKLLAFNGEHGIDLNRVYPESGRTYLHHLTRFLRSVT